MQSQLLGHRKRKGEGTLWADIGAILVGLVGSERGKVVDLTDRAPPEKAIGIGYLIMDNLIN